MYKKETGLLPLLLLDGLQSMISDYEKCGPYLQWIDSKETKKQERNAVGTLYVLCAGEEQEI